MQSTNYNASSAEEEKAQNKLVRTAKAIHAKMNQYGITGSIGVSIEFSVGSGASLGLTIEVSFIL